MSDTGSYSDDEEPESHYVYEYSLLRDFEPTKDGTSINYTGGAKSLGQKQHIKNNNGPQYKDISELSMMQMTVPQENQERRS